MRLGPRAVAIISLFALLVSGCGHAQIGPDRDTFKAVDALYTAVSMRDPGLLDRCASNLKELHTSGKLPDAAFRALEGYIAEARSGQWESSQGRLAQFMEAQRR